MIWNKNFVLLIIDYNKKIIIYNYSQLLFKCNNTYLEKNGDVNMMQKKSEDEEWMECG